MPFKDKIKNREYQRRWQAKRFLSPEQCKINYERKKKWRKENPEKWKEEKRRYRNKPEKREKENKARRELYARKLAHFRNRNRTWKAINKYGDFVTAVKLLKKLRQEIKGIKNE